MRLKDKQVEPRFELRLLIRLVMGLIKTYKISKHVGDRDNSLLLCFQSYWIRAKLNTTTRGAYLSNNLDQTIEQ